MSTPSEERGELTLFFDKAADEVTRFHFEEYILEHLQRRALPSSIKRRRIFICPNCSEAFSDSQIKSRRERGFDWITCSACDTKVSLRDGQEQFTTLPHSLVARMNIAADTQRNSETTQSIIEGKIEIKDFDVFLCHNSKDKLKVREIGEELKGHGILPWLDEWELQPGLPWQRLLEEQIDHIKSSAVFVGEEGIGPWQHEELDTFLREFIRRGCPVIPVLLPDAPKEPKLPPFLSNRTWVDFRRPIPDPMEQLIWGITGKKLSHAL